MAITLPLRSEIARTPGRVSSTATRCVSAGACGTRSAVIRSASSAATVTAATMTSLWTFAGGGGVSVGMGWATGAAGDGAGREVCTGLSLGLATGISIGLTAARRDAAAR